MLQQHLGQDAPTLQAIKQQAQLGRMKQQVTKAAPNIKSLLDGMTMQLDSIKQEFQDAQKKVCKAMSWLYLQFPCKKLDNSCGDVPKRINSTA